MNRRLSGLGLLELMVTVLILFIVLGGTVGILSMGKKSWQIGSAQLDVQQEARRAMDSMVRELRAANSIDNGTFVNGVSDGILRFNSGAQTIEFALNVAGYNPDQLIRTAGAANAVLANNIQSVQFNLLGGNVVYITLTTQKRSLFGQLVGTVITSQVVLRN